MKNTPSEAFSYARVWSACIRIVVASLLTTSSILNTARAQDFRPDRPIKVIVPVPAGTSPDLLARVFGHGLEAKWGQPVIIENRAGASHNIGADLAFKAVPDGYTLMSAPPPSLAINQYLFPKLAYDPRRFLPLTIMAEVANVLVVRRGLEVGSIKDLVTLARAKPGLLTYGSTGVGSTLHLSFEAFKVQTRTDFLHVPYGGAPAVVTELIAGRLDSAIISLADVFPHIATADIKVLGVGTDKPVPHLPDVPTISTLLPGYYSTSWFAVVAPPNTPAPVVETLSRAIREVLSEPAGRSLAEQVHGELILNGPEAAATFIRKDSERWAELIRANNIRAD